MKYVGSKARHAKEIIAVINPKKTDVWIEPFVGGTSAPPPPKTLPMKLTAIAYDQTQKNCPTQRKFISTITLHLGCGVGV